jgi:hypothetical protein
MFGHLRSCLPAKRIFDNENEAPRPAPPPPRFARCASSSGPPPPAIAGAERGGALATRQRLRLMLGEAQMEKLISIHRLHPLLFSSFTKKEGRRNAGKRWLPPPHLAMRHAPSGRARLSAFHHGSHLRELFHPKGSTSGQASWDAVCTGVTRLRLSQSRDAPPTPVVMPGDMMPKPPESSVQNHPRAPHPLHLSACLRKASFGERDKSQITLSGTIVNRIVTPTVTIFPPSPGGGRSPREARRVGVTAPKDARCSGIAAHPTPPAGACHRAGHFGPDPLGGRPSPCRGG